MLCCASQNNYLRYLDVSTGELVAEHKIENQFVNCMTKNQSNGIVAVGDNTGRVGFYSPNSAKPCAQIFVHKGNVQSVSITRNGNPLSLYS